MSQSSARRLQSTPSHHHHHQVGDVGGVGSGKRGHQRRQSVARLLPDISKLRLLSWLVEASSELIQCDIAIMDGVYAKLNRSRESLLFWNSHQQQQQPPVRQQQVSPPARPAPPTRQPVANRLVISQGQSPVAGSQLLLLQQQQRDSPTRASARNHHSLPITNYDASSLAAVSTSGSTTSGAPQAAARRLRKSAGATSSLPPQLAARPSTGDNQQQQQRQLQQQQEEESCDSQQSEGEDDDADSSASGSTSSSGIHGGDTSLSSAASTASTGSCHSNSSTESNSDTDLHLSPLHHRQHQQQRQQVAAQQQQQRPPASSAEQLSEKIRKTVMEHNYLQSLLVNIIRQHDRQRDLLNQQRRRQLSLDGGNGYQHHQHQHHHLQRIDLADIADALDDGCLCVCHSRRDPQPAGKPGRSSTLPVAGKAEAEQAAAAPTRKAIRLKKANNGGRGNSNSNNKPGGGGGGASYGGQGNTLPASLSGGAGAGSNESNRQDIINLLADKLCENCFETHYWLHGCSIELAQPAPKNRQQSDQQQSTGATGSSQDLNAIIAKRNATFIKLVQQEVRSTISKSIELIDLIRKEIKLPESIKQKQLMRCFSTSIQLLTSVGNYVVPSQDISSFIPEVGQQQTTLFSLPPSDFEHLLLYPPSLAQAVNLHQLNNNHHHQNNSGTSASTHYHLAQAPDIPIRRRLNPALSPATSKRQQQLAGQSQSHSLKLDGRGGGGGGSPIVNERNQNHRHGSLAGQAEQSLSSDFQKLKTTMAATTTTTDSTAAAAASTTDTTSTTDKPCTGIISTLGPGLTGLATDTTATATATTTTTTTTTTNDSSSGASSNNSSASSSIARGTVQQSSLTRAHTSSALLDGKTSHDLSFETIANLSRQHTEDDMLFQSRPKFWQSSKFNFIKKLLHVKQQRLLRQQSKDRRIYNNKVQNKFRLVMMDLTHFNKSQQLLTTENGVNSLLTSMRNVLEFGLYLTLKLY